MNIIIKRASFNADDFNSENNCRKFGSAQNVGNFVTIEVADQSIDAFKESLRETYSYLDEELAKYYAEHLDKRQTMIRQIITKMFKP
jgi:hypothetical protein